MLYELSRLVGFSVLKFRCEKKEDFRCQEQSQLMLACKFSRRLNPVGEHGFKELAKWRKGKLSKWWNKLEENMRERTKLRSGGRKKGTPGNRERKWEQGVSENGRPEWWTVLQKSNPPLLRPSARPAEFTFPSSSPKPHVLMSLSAGSHTYCTSLQNKKIATWTHWHQTRELVVIACFHWKEIKHIMLKDTLLYNWCSTLVFLMTCLIVSDFMVFLSQS